MRIELIGLEGLPEVRPGDDLAALVCDAAETQRTPIVGGDVVVVAQKIVSKSEGRVVPLNAVVASPLAVSWGEEHGIDARVVELVLRESRRIVRMDRGVLVTETHGGHVCANAGVDLSNVAGGSAVTLLPRDCDASAKKIQEGIQSRLARDVAVVVSDSFGRPWREAQVNVALGVAGMAPVVDHAGKRDPQGHLLRASAHAIADEIAAAAGLVAGKLARIPVVLVRGARYEKGESSCRPLLRAKERDLFR